MPGCATFVVTFLGLFTSLLTVSKVPFRHSVEGLRKQRFWLAGVLLFRNRALRGVFAADVFDYCFRGSKGATSAPCEWPFFASLELGFRLCFAVSHPLPRGCRFAFVQARLRHVFCLRTGALFFSFRGSKGATSHPCEWPFFASPELGFRWCLAVSDPLPSGCRCAFVATYWGSFLFLPELGFRWCFAVSHLLPKGCRFAFDQG